MVAATRSFPDSASRLEFFGFSFPEMSGKGAIPAGVFSDTTGGDRLGGECDALFLISCLSRLLGLSSSGIILRNDEQGGKRERVGRTSESRGGAMERASVPDWKSLPKMSV
jgi:hypothetical protein